MDPSYNDSVGTETSTARRQIQGGVGDQEVELADLYCRLFTQLLRWTGSL